MKKPTENEKRDRALYFKEEGDPGFSPERNRKIIENSIKKYDAMRAKKAREYKDLVGERVDAVVSYLRSNTAASGYGIEKYLSKRHLAYLQGQKIVKRIKRLKNGSQVITLEEIN